MKNILEGCSSYLTSFTAFFVSVNWEGVGSTLLMIGSIVLLIMRLYVEYNNFKSKWRNNHSGE
jgi:TM2 domain-containing membrane protein YozV